MFQLIFPCSFAQFGTISGSSEYQLNQNGSVDISRRELSAPAGAQYLRRSGDGSLNVRTNHRERFHTKTGPVEHPPAFPRPVIGADRQRWHLKRRPVGRIGEHASPVPIVPVHEITPPGCRRISDRSRPDTCGLSSWNTWDAHASPCRTSTGTSTGAVTPRPRRSGTRHGNRSRHVLLVLGRLPGRRLGNRISTRA